MALDGKLIAMCDGEEVEITYADGEMGKAFVTKLGDPTGYERHVDFSQLSEIQSVTNGYTTYYGKPHFIRRNNTPQQLLEKTEYKNVVYVTVQDHPGIKENRPA